MWRVTWTPAGSPFPEWEVFKNGRFADRFAARKELDGATHVRVYELEEDQ